MSDNYAKAQSLILLVESYRDEMSAGSARSKNFQRNVAKSKIDMEIDMEYDDGLGQDFHYRRTMPDKI
jgi:hypothetical protein